MQILSISVSSLSKNNCESVFRGTIMEEDIFDDDVDEVCVDRKGWERRQDGYLKDGFRDGIAEGHGETLQKGFNDGFSQNLEEFQSIGKLRGLLCGVHSFYKTQTSSDETRTIWEKLESLIQKISDTEHDWMQDQHQPDEQQVMSGIKSVKPEGCSLEPDNSSLSERTTREPASLSEGTAREPASLSEGTTRKPGSLSERTAREPEVDTDFKGDHELRTDDLSERKKEQHITEPSTGLLDQEANPSSCSNTCCQNTNCCNKECSCGKNTTARLDSTPPEDIHSKDVPEAGAISMPQGQKGKKETLCQLQEETLQLLKELSLSHIMLR